MTHINHFKGNVNDGVDFHYEEGTTVDYGCGATLMNEFHYFGGYGSQKRQVFPESGTRISID